MTSTTGDQYVVLSHVLAGVYYRASIIDLTTYEYRYWVVPQTEIPAAAPAPFQVAYDGYVMEALSADNYSIMRTTSDNGENSLNLTWSSDRPILYNMGLGYFKFGSTFAHEWSMPSGRTEGTLTLDGKEVTIDPDNSFTWYDRQWQGQGTPANWTWFELHLPGDVKASIWAWNSTIPEQQTRAGTFQYPDGSTKILTFTLTHHSRYWTSPNTNFTYPLNWELAFDNGDNLQVSSIYYDQELAGDTPVATAYEGFALVSGTFNGVETSSGFGLVEMATFS